MRMRDQLIVTIAVALATIAVAGNALAQTRASNQRIEIEQAGLAVAWSYPIMDPARFAQPADTDSGPASRQAEGGSGTESADPSDTPDDPAVSCSGQRQCASEEGPTHYFMNHGRLVSAYVHSLGFEEGVDGPRGAYVRQIARPDIDNDGPPRSERAEEKQDEDKKDENAPPGQDKKDKDD